MRRWMIAAACVAALGCGGEVSLSGDAGAEAAPGTTGRSCYLKFTGSTDAVACEGAGFTWTDDAGVHDCSEPCPVAAACDADGKPGVCR